MSTAKPSGQILREAHQKKGLIQVEVADKTGLHPNTYAKIERGDSS